MTKNLGVVVSSGVLVLALAAAVSPALAQGSTHTAVIALQYKPQGGDPPVITH
jgi:hypothetical protein